MAESSPVQAPLREHPYASQSLEMRRRYSFSTAAYAEIERGRSEGVSSSKSPRKCVSFSAVSSPGVLQEVPGRRQQTSFGPSLSPVHSPRKQDGRNAEDDDSDDDDDSDGDDEVYSPVCSDDDDDDDLSPTKFAAVAHVVSKPPLVDQVQTADPTPTPPLAPAIDEPSSTKNLLQQRTTEQVELEIRHAIDSAEARVQEELSRREQFEGELHAALSCIPISHEVESSAQTGATSDVEFEDHEDIDDFVASILTSPSSSTPPVQDPQESRHSLGELLLIMDVVIGDGRSETIEVHTGDRPADLATAFAAKYALRPEAIPTLTQHIQDQLDALALAEKEAEFGEHEAYHPNATHALPDERNHEVIAHESLQDATAIPFSPPVQPDSDVIITPPTAQIVECAYTTSLSSKQHENPAAQEDTKARENIREYNYNCLMAKYGHYSQHSGKVNPSSTNGNARNARASDELTLRNVELAEYTRVTSPERFNRVDSGNPAALDGTKKTMTMTTARRTKKQAAPPVFERLHALAESRDKWLQRAQRVKAAEEEREQVQLQNEMAVRTARSSNSKGSVLTTNRTTTGSYTHAGERLYEEAIADLAKKERRREQRAVEREEQIDWMCPKCAFVNHFNDEWCKNVIAISVGATSTKPSSTGSSAGVNADRADPRTQDPPRHDTTTISRGLSLRELAQQLPESVCGQPKPALLFRPTLISAPVNITRAITKNKDNGTVRTASSAARRERNQRAMEEEFQKTCPFRPTINEVSVDIVREKLESEARAAGRTTAPKDLRRRDPHAALYEESFQARANRDAREREYYEQFSFKPDIGVNALWVPTEKSSTDFVERLAVSSYHELEQKRYALHDKYAPADRDPETGRELFKPEVGRAPAFNRNEKKLPIGEFLYEAHREHREYLRQLQEQHQVNIRQKQEQGFVSEASRQALARRQKDTCTRIFNALLGLDGGADRLESDRQAASASVDSESSATEALSSMHSGDEDGQHSSVKSGDTGATEAERDPVNSDTRLHRADQADGVVVPRRVDLTKLPAEIGRVVSIVFEFANYEEITRCDFEKYLDRLIRDVPGLTYTHVLSLTELLDDGKSSRRRTTADSKQTNLEDADLNELTFAPSIDKNSRAIVTKHGRADHSKVFVALNQYFDHYKMKRKEIERQHQREFKKTHPFQPKLVTKSHERQRAAANFYEKVTQLDRAQEPPPAPVLPTAIANARPSVRPIDCYEPPIVAAVHSPESRESQEEKSISSTLDDDADLTSRVLAALDEHRTVEGGRSGARAFGAGNIGESSFAKLNALVHDGLGLHHSPSEGKERGSVDIVSAEQISPATLATPAEP